MLVKGLADKASRARSQTPRARRGNRDSKVTARIAIEAVSRSRELAVPETSSPNGPGPPNEIRRQMAVWHRISTHAVDDDAGNLITRRVRICFDSCLVCTVRLGLTYAGTQTCQHDKNSPKPSASSHGVTSATGTASRFSVGLSPAFTVTEWTWLLNGARLAGSR